MSLIVKLKQNLINIPGWRTKRKIVVFESDDWGMIRMASKQAYDRLLRKGYPVDQCPYNSNDALESNADLEGLMEVLHSVKDKNNNPAKFTLNNIVANPDFEKIRESNFEEYHYEPFTATLEKYPDSDRTFNLYLEGLEAKLFQVQFHGREHIHVNNWLRALRNKAPLFVSAFEVDMFTQYKGRGSSCQAECLDAMAAYNLNDKKYIEHAIQEGLNLFQFIWGFYSKSVIAPCYTWHSDLESHFTDLNIRYLQGGRAQREPQTGSNAKTIKRHFTGQKTQNGLTYLVRNVQFEPVENPDQDWIDTALKEIGIAFTWRKPAIISTHRVNYIGRINPKNRDNNLKLLQELLKQLVQRWPDIEFMSTDEFGDMMTKRG